MDNYVAIATCMSQLTLGHALKAALEKLRHVSPQEISVWSLSKAFMQVVFALSAVKAAVHSTPDEHAVSYA